VISNVLGTRLEVAEAARVKRIRLQEQQVQRMTQRSLHPNHIVPIGTVVSISVPRSLRSTLDPLSLVCVVVEHTNGHFHRLATQDALLDTCYRANDIAAVSDLSPDVFNLQHVLGSWHLFPTVTMKAIATVGREQVRCGCKKGCNTRMCACRRHGRSCTTRCHPRCSCLNK